MKHNDFGLTRGEANVTYSILWYFMVLSYLSVEGLSGGILLGKGKKGGLVIIYLLYLTLLSDHHQSFHQYSDSALPFACWLQAPPLIGYSILQFEAKGKMYDHSLSLLLFLFSVSLRALMHLTIIARTRGFAQDTITSFLLPIPIYF